MIYVCGIKLYPTHTEVIIARKRRIYVNLRASKLLAYAIAIVWISLAETFSS